MAQAETATTLEIVNPSEPTTAEVIDPGMFEVPSEREEICLNPMWEIMNILREL